METLCQRILWLCLINFLGTVNSAYLLESLAISESSLYLIPDHYQIDIATSPWLVTHLYHYSYILIHPYKQGRPQSHTVRNFLSTTEMQHIRY